ncbi:alpha/beta fold hydrolase, partial [Acinetobacter baumannii]
MTSRIVAPYPGVSYALSEQGSGPTVLVLHGGAGPDSVDALARHLSTRHRVFVPTHPGWGDSARPAWFTGIGRLAEMYLELLDDDGADDVVLVGSSIGGWLASEMALRDRGRRISALVLVDGVGIAPVSAPA